MSALRAAGVGLVLALALHPALAPATTVLCYGDSITKGMWGSRGYPAALAAMRPDLQVINGGQTGDNTRNRGRLNQLLAEHQPDVVVILLGTNDPSATISLRDSERNLRSMASDARAAGARVLLLTPTPAGCRDWLTFRCDEHDLFTRNAVVRQEHTRRLAHMLMAARPKRGVQVVDLRDAFTLRPWLELTTDGLHPNDAGDQAIAEVVAGALFMEGL